MNSSLLVDFHTFDPPVNDTEVNFIVNTVIDTWKDKDPITESEVQELRAIASATKNRIVNQNTGTFSFDLDGVVVDFDSALTSFSTADRSVLGERTATYGYDGWFKNREEFLVAHDKAMEGCADFAVNDPFILDSLDLVTSHGFRPIAVTAREDKWKEGTLAQLRNAGIVFDNVIFAGRETPKSSFDFDYAIDDAGYVIRDMMENTSAYVGVYNDRYNRHVPSIKGHIVRVNNTLEFTHNVLGI